MMTRYGRIIALTLLTLNAIGALSAGYMFMTDPSGQKMGLTISLLEFSPFKDYYIPGFILFVANGIFSSLTVYLILINYKYAYNFITAQGSILAGWIFIQMIMLRMIYPLHVLMGGVGVILIYIGFSKILKL